MDPGLSPPRLISLSSSGRDHESSKKVWEVGVPRKNSLYWSIILAYLTTPNIPDISVFRHRMLRIIDDLSDVRQAHARGKKLQLSSNLIGDSSLRKRLQNFNPFKNRHTFFFDKDVVQVLKIFKWRLNKFSNNIASGSRRNDERKLEGASQMLACSIEVGYVENGNERCASFPKARSAASGDQILLFHHKTDDKFRFGMGTRFADPLQKTALSFILRKARITGEHGVENALIDSNEIFLLNLLKCMKASNIVDLFKSPYIVLKLSEAGFETNPLAVDSGGMTAFCHAVRRENTKVCATLYDSAVNHHWLSGNSIREPDEAIVGGLQAVKNALDNDETLVKGFEGWSRNARDIFQAYTRFNAFQLKLVKQIIALKKEEENFTSRKELTLALLDFYEEFSYNDDLSDNNAWFQNYYNDYAHQKIYYEMLDTFTCISFFDNLHFLLENIPLQMSTTYDDINSDFLLLILCNNNFTTDKNYKLQEEISSKSKKFISLIFKMNLKLKLDDLHNKLQSTKIQPQKAKKVETDTFYRKALIDAPEIKDEIIICKVKRYLEASSNVELHKDTGEEERMKAILVFERTIQILGECLKPSTARKCIVSHLMCSCLPYGWEESLTKSRNFLSHLTGNDVQKRLALEKNLDLFLKIQEQLFFINENFQTVYLFQKQRIQKFLINCGSEAVKMFPPDSEAIVKFSNEYQTHANRLKELWLEREEDYIPLLTRYIEYLKLCVERYCCIDTSRSFSNKVVVLGDFIENIAQYYDERNLELSEYVNRCHEILPFSKEKEARECSKHKKTTISEVHREKVKNILEELQKHVEQSFHQKENRDFLCGFKSTAGEFFGHLTEHSSFTKQEMSEIMVIAESMYKKTKRELEINFEEDRTKTDLQCFILNQKLLKKIKINQTDTKTLLTCCYTWDRFESELDVFLEKNLLEAPECRILLLTICSGSELNEELKQKLLNVTNQRIEFLLQRIDCIRQILISEDEEISHYFRWGKSEGLKYHTQFLMIQRCMKELDVRASLEMLLFDCSNLLERKDLSDLWSKTKHLLAGINIRDVLAHGNVVLDTIGGLLDPKDMPTELVGKMLELVKDGEFISKMVKLYKSDAWYHDKAGFKAALRKDGLLIHCPRLEKYLELMSFA